MYTRERGICVIGIMNKLSFLRLSGNLRHEFYFKFKVKVFYFKGKINEGPNYYAIKYSVGVRFGIYNGISFYSWSEGSTQMTWR